MPAATDSVLTQGVVLSAGTTMLNGVPRLFTTPSVDIGAAGFRADQPLVMDVFIPSFTNHAAGAATRPYLTLVIQEASGDPTVEANWRDLVWMKQIRPWVPPGSNGAGGSTLSTAVFSNRFRQGFQTDRRYVRLSGQFLGSHANFGLFRAAIVPAIRRSHELD